MGQDFDIGVPLAFDELGGQDAHGTVAGGKGLVQLGHPAPKHGHLFDQVHAEAQGG
jgi:hypothetical protein